MPSVPYSVLDNGDHESETLRPGWCYLEREACVAGYEERVYSFWGDRQTALVIVSRQVLLLFKPVKKSDWKSLASMTDPPVSYPSASVFSSFVCFLYSLCTGLHSSSSITRLGKRAERCNSTLGSPHARHQFRLRIQWRAQWSSSTYCSGSSRIHRFGDTTCFGRGVEE